jgi:hypothetical protein
MSDTTKTADPVTADLMGDVPVGSRDLATQGQQSTAIAPADMAAFNAHSMMAMVERLALDERIDAGKLETVMRVANQQQDREREIQFYQDKNRAVREMPLIRKDGKIVILDKNNPTNMELARVQGHFERWADVQAAVTPVLDRHYLTLTHKVDHADGQTIVIAVLTHDNGYREESGPMRLPLDTSGGKNNVQGAGSSQTYGMRYTARAICGLKLVGGQGDDNGNLIPLPDEPLNDQQLRRIKEAQIAWQESPEKFEEWMHSMEPKDRMWFVQSGRYAEITGRQQLPGTSPAPRDPGLALKPDEPNTDTPEGWTVQYERDLEACETLDAFSKVADRGSKAVGRLKEGGHAALHKRAQDAERKAYDRLNGGN